MLDNTIEITYLQGKLTENLKIQCILLEKGTNFTFLRTRQVELEEQLENLKKANSTEAA